ncbi:MAG: hypothetical protein ATN35_07495 [Epulopiscium sp. Nele67-Bin004]|nr:MAG: hypothetical protein ATN35_07495 [Epulopiscium sp. Nele67-Bin004]
MIAKSSPDYHEGFEFGFRAGEQEGYAVGQKNGVNQGKYENKLETLLHFIYSGQDIACFKVEHGYSDEIKRTAQELYLKGLSVEEHCKEKFVS